MSAINDSFVRSRQRAELRSQGGFTALEVAISLAIFGLLITCVFSIIAETSGYMWDNDLNTTVQAEGQRAFQRMTETLRKSGRVTLGGVTYPRVVNGGKELEFAILSDLDGNGYPFNAATGALEWSANIYTIKLDASNCMDIYDGSGKVFALGRFIRNLSFQTIVEDPTLFINEITVTFESRRTNLTGVDFIYPVTGSIEMRN